MATLTIRNVDDELKSQLRVMAAEHGRSMEAEVREILRVAIARRAASEGMATRIRRRMEPFYQEFGGELELELPDRSDPGRPVELPE